MTSIAVVGMACRYPDAASPTELWENALAGRRAFRRLPDVRMNLADYWDPDPGVPDRFYARNAAVIEGYEFDRVAYKIAGSTYRSADLTHWLALDVAAQALADAGFPLAEGLPRERTGVVVGNTLTGEFARANLMRLRWPYVRRTVAAALRERDWDDEALSALLGELEAAYKSPFPEIDEDTLAGGLSNTIAGRICNYFDLNGGGYTVDGACSSSLLSVVTACRALVDRELDVAVAGGVDLSIDPFEIIGFAKTGALASGEMRVYDRRSNGFWPGEGCGMVVLMRADDARRAGHRVYATLAGWGVSSDGKGGITRPEVSGYQLALRRAYESAGFGIETVALFEGHGTGTEVGDATELTALSRARRDADPNAAPAAIGSIKAMIGHTKAAAGVAGLIKATMALHHQVLPPTVGCVEPHETFAEERPVLRMLRKAEPWPEGTPVRAGVTSMGFGGINTHLVLERTQPRRRVPFDSRTRALAASVQDVELLAVDADSPQALGARLAELVEFVPRISYAQLADLAATLRDELRDRPYRAAVVASSPEDAERQLRRVVAAVEAGETRLFAADGRAFLGYAGGPGRIGFLFPGQGSGKGISGGALRRRFAEAEQVYAAAALPTGRDVVATEVAQPRIVTGSMAGLAVLAELGVEADLAVGHSLGELSALHWAGAMSGPDLLRVAATRGRTMAEHSASGTMASVAAGPDVVRALVDGLPVVVAGYNGPEQTVVAGPVEAVGEAVRRAGAEGHAAVVLRVSHAFHSPLVAPAAARFGALLTGERFGPVARRVVSTVTGESLPADVDVPALLHRQITDPVLFHQAVCLAAKDVDLFVEVGPGAVLSGLSAAVTDVPSVALDTDDESMAGLLRVVAAAYVIGAAGVHPTLFAGRPVRPLRLGQEFSFFASPCEQAPDVRVAAAVRGTAAPARPAAEPASVGSPADPAVELLRRLAADRAELPVDMVGQDSRLLDDLHLSSITVSQLVNETATRLGVPPSRLPTNLATATVREVADALDTLVATGRPDDLTPPVSVAGAAPFVRAFAVELADAPPPAAGPPEQNGTWRVYAPDGHPLAEPLRRVLEGGRVGSGVLVCLPPDCAESDLELALRGAQAAAGGAAGDRFVLAQRGRGAAALARTLRLEAPAVRTTVVDTPATADAAARVLAEVAATVTYREAHYDGAGTRRLPTLRALPVRPDRVRPPLDGTDVLLVTGGGKGITAECALVLAVDSGARLALLGRSDPATDAELAANLERFAAAGVRVRYLRVDVRDASAVRAAVAEATAELGPVTAVLHGAGYNAPAALGNLHPDAFRDAIAPKVDGLRAVLEAVRPERLRLLVTFGSIIGRAGLRGEAHYATANEWLADLTTRFGAAHPHCRTLCLEWSVWSGTGMGERLSVVESLAREGITPIGVDEGVELLRRLVADPDAPPVMVVSGRTQGIETLRYEEPELPLLRFVGRPIVRYHGVELVTDVELSAGTDPYLADHLLDGNLLFPAVFGMEAMAQVAAAATGSTAAPVFEDVEFARPIVVRPEGSTTIRIAAVVTDDDTVRVVIRSAETGFAADHFTARLTYRAPVPLDGPPEQVPDGVPPVPLDPAREMYGDTLFQGARFQRLLRYHRAAARHVDADVAASRATDWFAPYLPADLVLGDPGVRDALMHGNQVCVPDATLLPIGIDRLHPAGPALGGLDEVRYTATERDRDGDTYVYDIAVRTPAGEVVERWEGLRLRAVRRKDGRGPWVAPLLGPYLERALGDLLGARVAVAVEPLPAGAVDPADPTGPAAARALGHAEPGNRVVARADGGGITLCVAATGLAGCAVEPVTAQPRGGWAQSLGPHEGLLDEVTGAAGEEREAAAARLRAALACLARVGLPPHVPLALTPVPRDAWLVFGSGTVRIATLVTRLRGGAAPLAVAVLTDDWS
jgi:enediyne polyketide synthase